MKLDNEALSVTLVPWLNAAYVEKPQKVA
jgi:hypothetical protein